MDTRENRIARILKRKNGNEIDAAKMLEDKYQRVFGNDYLERVEVIDIQTAYNDCKKLHDDLYSPCLICPKSVPVFSPSEYRLYRLCFYFWRNLSSSGKNSYTDTLRMPVGDAPFDCAADQKA